MRQKRKNALRDTKQEVLRLERFQTNNAAINRITSEFFSFRLGVVAQRKAEVNGKKFLHKTIKIQNMHATIFVLFR